MQVKGRFANYHEQFRMVRQIKISRNRFRYVLVANIDILSYALGSNHKAYASFLLNSTCYVVMLCCV